jgi:hypothetical protein
MRCDELHPVAPPDLGEDPGTVGLDGGFGQEPRDGLE